MAELVAPSDPTFAAIPHDIHHRIDALLAEMIGMPQVECPVKHVFAPGMYGREMVSPAGTVMVGETLTVDHLCVISAGSVTVYTDDGPVLLKAPMSFAGKPGTRRVGYVHEELVWMTVFPNPTNESDVDVLMLSLTEPRLNGSGQLYIPGTQSQEIAP